MGSSPQQDVTRAGASNSVFGSRAGKILAEIELPSNQTGLPFTYEHEGVQYVAMFVGGGPTPAELIALALP